MTVLSDHGAVTLAQTPEGITECLETKYVALQGGVRPTEVRTA